MPRRSPLLLAAAGDILKTTPRPSPSRRQVQKPVQPPGPLNALPIEWVMHILHFDNLKHVFVSMRVCRTWEKAARAEISRRERLQIISLVSHEKVRESVSFWNPLVAKSERLARKKDVVSHEKIREYVSGFMIHTFVSRRERLAVTFRAELLSHMSPLDAIVCDGHVPDSLVKSVTRGMAHLKVLIYCSHNPADDQLFGQFDLYEKIEEQIEWDCELDGILTDDQRIIPLVLNNSETLQVLDINCDLPLDWFPKLRKLGCRGLEADAVAAFPRLSSLAVWYPLPDLQVLQMLDADRLQSLHIFYEWEGESFKPPVQALHRLVNLKVFHLEMKMGHHCYENIVVAGDGLEQVFDHFTHLEEVYLVYDGRYPGEEFWDDDSYDMDEAVVTLAERNPHLRRLVFEGFDLTNDSLYALSELEQLSGVELDRVGGEIDKDGVISLLKGDSRHQLDRVKIVTYETVDPELIDKQIDAIAEGTGCVFSHRKVSEWGVEFVVQKKSS